MNNSDYFELFLCSLESEQELLVMFDLFVIAIFHLRTAQKLVNMILLFLVLGPGTYVTGMY